jgi:cytochrome c biogenesis protein CcmG/thiol:disulfide interchange protein DsbE
VFATWCRPCVQEHPQLVAFDEAHRETGDVELVSVLFDDRPSTARAFFEDRGGEWPVVVDGDGRIATDYGVSGVPETYVVAPDGRVVAKLIGGVTSDGLDRVIAEAGGSGGSGSGSPDEPGEGS